MPLLYCVFFPSNKIYGEAIVDKMWITFLLFDFCIIIC